jgi:AcrR family transcriptional regulator
MEGSATSPLRAKIMRAMLLSSGEVGYRSVTVRLVCERFGGSAADFYAEFSGTSDCFVAAYEAEAERVSSRLQSCIELHGPCRHRIEAALRELIALAVDEPAVARALFVEVHVAGGEALDLQRRILRRLVGAVEARGAEAAGPATPALTGEFIVGVVEQAITSSVARDRLDELHEAAPELAMILGRFYDDGADTG